MTMEMGGLKFNDNSMGTLETQGLLENRNKIMISKAKEI